MIILEFSIKYPYIFIAIRLVSGRESDMVQVKINGQWGGVCDDGFNMEVANVVCRQVSIELVRVIQA